MKTNRETDKLLFGVFTKLVFWNTNCFLKPGLIKSKRKMNTQWKHWSCIENIEEKLC